jgi:hypothetical protein
VYLPRAYLPRAYLLRCSHVYLPRAYLPRAYLLRAGLRASWVHCRDLHVCMRVDRWSPVL